MKVTVNGANFGATQGSSTIIIGGVRADVISWSDTKIVTTVPEGASSGAIVVQTSAGATGWYFPITFPTWYLAEGSTAWGFNERAMYRSAERGTGYAMHDSIGVPAAHTTWYLPDGYASSDDNGTETYTLVQNPTPVDIPVQITYLTRTGTGNVTFTDTVKANTRKTYSMSDKLKRQGRVHPGTNHSA